MGLETKRMFGVRASFCETEVIVYPNVHLYSANRAADPDENLAGDLDQLRTDRSDPMQLKMARALHLYVLLKFLPGSAAADKPLALTVVFHHDIAPLIVIRHDWQTRLDAKNRKYLSKLMDDWTRTPPERVLALFRQLECLSIGPIRATVSGIATAETLEHLMYAVLRHAGAPGQCTM
jgi:hypothetical protein